MSSSDDEKKRPSSDDKKSHYRELSGTKDPPSSSDDSKDSKMALADNQLRAGASVAFPVDAVDDNKDHRDLGGKKRGKKRKKRRKKGKKRGKKGKKRGKKGKKLTECEFDCDRDSDCADGLLCADEHGSDLERLGLDRRKAYCGDVGRRVDEVCYDPAKIDGIESGGKKGKKDNKKGKKDNKKGKKDNKKGKKDSKKGKKDSKKGKKDNKDSKDMSFFYH